MRLSPRQTVRIFDAVRSGDPEVRGLYADLEGEGFGLIADRARGTVMRAYSADGVARGGGIVVELPHEGPGGALAWFHLSAREEMGDAASDDVSADYSVWRGGRVETRTAKGGRARSERYTRRGRGVIPVSTQAPGR